jgi:hypothetical protein
MKKTCIIKFKKKDGKLSPKDGIMKERLKQFILSIEESEEIECIMEAIEPNNTKAQLAKIHVMIKEISDETGDDVKQVKRDIKDQCGMTYYVDNKKVYKSFADLNKKDLSDAIEKIYLIGEFLNINFKEQLH